MDEVFIAFNANTDYIINFKKLPFNLKNVNSNAELPSEVRDETGLKKALVNALKRGEAVELRAESEEYYNSLINQVKPGEKRIGGQMGIVANNLARLGVNKVIAYTNPLSKELSKLFHKNVLYPVVNEGEVVLKPINECGGSESTRVNLIIEYKKGEEVRTKDGSFTVPRNNRFILSSPVKNSKPVLKKSLLKKCLFENVNRVFLSGYHHISKRDKRLFKKLIEQVKMMKEFNPRMLIHVEYVDLHKHWLNKELFKLLKHVHSFGMNEVELGNLMKYLGKKSIHQLIKDTDYSIEGLIRAGSVLMKEFNLQRVSIHTLPYMISLTRKDYPISKEVLLHANIYGIRVVNSKGISNKGFVKELRKVNKYALSPEGVLNASRDYETSYDLIIVPNFNSEEVPVKFTVGLGDTISSAVFFAEEALNN